MNQKFKIILILSLLLNLSAIYIGYKALDYRSHINDYLDKYTNLVNDYSLRSVYFDQNQALLSDTIVPGRIVFIGTQVINNWNLEKYFKPPMAVNRGIGGQRIGGCLLRFESDVISLKPEYVFIEVSSYNFRPSNNSEEIFENVISMASLARANNIKPILTTIIPPTSDFEFVQDCVSCDDYMMLDSLSEWNQKLIDYAILNNFDIVDMNKILSNENGNLRKEFALNSVEPNETAYKFISDAVIKIIKD